MAAVRPKVHIRRAQPEDAEPLYGLIESIENFSSEEVAVAKELVNAAITDPQGSGYEVLVAYNKGQLLGYVCFGQTPLTSGTFDLYWIAVHPQYRGQGIGQGLHQAMLEELRKRDARLVRVETSSQDSYKGTLSFYKRLGYELVSRVEDFYRPGDDLLTLVLRLGCFPPSSSRTSGDAK